MIDTDAIGDVTKMTHKFTQRGIRIFLTILSQKLNTEIYPHKTTGGSDSIQLLVSQVSR